MEISNILPVMDADAANKSTQLNSDEEGVAFTDILQNIESTPENIPIITNILKTDSTSATPVSTELLPLNLPENSLQDILSTTSEMNLEELKDKPETEKKAKDIDILSLFPLPIVLNPNTDTELKPIHKNLTQLETKLDNNLLSQSKIHELIKRMDMLEVKTNVEKEFSSNEKESMLDVLTHQSDLDNKVAMIPPEAQFDKIYASNIQVSDPKLVNTHTNINVDSHISTPQWKHDFSENIVYIAKNDYKGASIHLNPPELGPVEVKLTVKDNVATVMFHATHAEVRKAIEDTLPQLREMLAGQGIHHVNVDVSDKRSQSETAHTSAEFRGLDNHDENADEKVNVNHLVTHLNQLVDYYI